MMERPTHSTGDPRAARRAGERARELPSAAPAEIDVALGRPDLDLASVLQILRNRRTTAPQLERIGKDSRFNSEYEVRKRLFQHVNTPISISRRLAPLLFWKDLADAVATPALPPVARRRAEQVLEQRLEGLTLGERTSLARRASRPLIPKLAATHEDRVLRGLLDNHLTVEADVVRIAEAEETPPAFLAYLAEHPAWGSTRGVGLGLVGNARTPIPAALKVLESLSTADLRPLARDDSVPTIVRVGAARVLSRRGSAGPTESTTPPSEGSTPGSR